MKPISFSPPNASLFAGVQVDVPDPEGRDGRRIVGAAPAFSMDGEQMVPLACVEVACELEPGDTEMRAVWAYEDSTLPNEQTDMKIGARRRRLGGPR